MRGFIKSAVLLVCAILIPTAVYAQASIGGTVKDTSGAVLPGVTVEVSSPALIEKTRSAVTDGTGQFQITNLPPGTYGVTYALEGFNTVKRDGVVLTGAFAATVNADLRVGSLAETITVTGETPIVDVQNTTGEKVMTKDIIDAIPNGRGTYDLPLLIPGVIYGNGGSGSTTQSVGGAQGNGTSSLSGLSVHGGRSSDQIYLQNGVQIASLAMSSFASAMVVNPVATQEMVVDTSAVSAEYPSGGIRLNAITRDGGNTFRGTFFTNFANSSMQGNNLTQSLKDAGLKTPDTIDRIYDINPGFGGPIMKDRLWFFESVRYQTSSSVAANAFYNVNANNPNAWTYVPDLTRPGINDYWQKDQQLRLSWQASARNKFGLNWHEENQCFCPSTITSTTAPEAAQLKRYPLLNQMGIDWSNPLTSRLLVEAGALVFQASSTVDPTDQTNLKTMIPVTDQASGLAYRGMSGYRNRPSVPIQLRGGVSYITGAHSVKVGFNHTSGPTYNHQFTNATGLAYRFNNGVPNQITEFAYPFDFETDLDHSLGIFAQDKWSVKHFTIMGGVRLDYLANSFAESKLGPTVFAPTRNITFPSQKNLSLKDVTPHFGVAYDVFGNGKTALKASVNKYLTSLASDQIAAALNPAANTVTSTTRSWTDTNKNFVPDCNLQNPGAQTVTGGDVCGALANQNFGSSVSALAIDPTVLAGWGKRGYNWEFSTGIQQEIMPRVSVDVSYFRRIYGNMLVTDSRALAATDYTAFSITAPVDPRLPGGGGYTVSGQYNLNPNKFGLSPDNYLTFADNYGAETEHWNGVDINMTARPRSSLLFQGGISTGKRTSDDCALISQLPELTLPASNNSLIGALTTIGGSTYCHTDSGFQSNVKFLGSYTIPKVDVLVSGTFQSLAGPGITAQYTALNAQIQPSLGRPLSGGAANQVVELVAPGALWGQRLYQLDLRFGKIVKMGRVSTKLNLDVYNALNANPVTAVNTSFAVWQQPTTILLARFAKVGVQFDF